MGCLINVLFCLASIQMAYLLPIQGDLNPLYEDYRMRLAKKEGFGPFKESFLTSLGWMDNSREGIQSQRKKAVDSTFIRFGRSSSAETIGKDRSAENPSGTLTKHLPEMQNNMGNLGASPEAPDNDQPNYMTSPRRLLLNHNGCRVSNNRDLVRALMNDRNCIRAFQKVKRENVNDTFIRFGKREAPSEKEFEPLSSDETR